MRSGSRLTAPRAVTLTSAAIVTWACSVALTSGIAWADPAGTPASSPNGPPPEAIVVTATRTRQPLSEVGQSISVIDSADITRRQYDAVVDLLRNVPGLTITRNGGIGTTSSVYIRGAESDQTVALIDGVKLNDPSSPGGGFNFGNLLVGNISRIEVLRGAQSVVWGSQAIGGVVNIETAEPTETLTANARAEYGWRDTRELVGNISQKLGPVKASIGAGQLETDGISAFNETRGGAERDGYRNFGANAKFDIEISDNVSVDLRGWYSRGKVGIDGFPAPAFSFADTREYSRARETVGYSALNVSMLDGRLHNRLATAYTETDRSNIDPDGFIAETFAAVGRNTRFEYQGILDVTEAVRTTFGVETERSRFTSVSYGGPPTRGEARMNSAYVEFLARPFTGLTVTAGARRDDHDEFGGKTTTDASLAWTPNAGATIVRASFSEGFKAPTLYQLQSEYGNRQLNPETARSFDAGITQRLLGEVLEVSATLFRRNSHDLINFTSCFEPLVGVCADRPFGVYANVARARAQGGEFTLTGRPSSALTFQANYSYVDAEDRSRDGDVFGNSLVRRPKETASALIDYVWPFRLETGATLTHVGASFDNASNTRRVEGYDVVDLRVAYALTDTMHVQARLENAFDEKYETIFRYGTPGRAAYVGVRLSY